jgi:hypothetical protein
MIMNIVVKKMTVEVDLDGQGGPEEAFRMLIDRIDKLEDYIKTNDLMIESKKAAVEVKPTDTLDDVYAKSLPHMVSIKTIAKMFNVDAYTVHDRINSNKLRREKLKGKVYMYKEDVEKLPLDFFMPKRGGKSISR